MCPCGTSHMSCSQHPSDLFTRCCPNSRSKASQEAQSHSGGQHHVRSDVSLLFYHGALSHTRAGNPLLLASPSITSMSMELVKCSHHLLWLPDHPATIFKTSMVTMTTMNTRYPCILLAFVVIAQLHLHDHCHHRSQADHQNVIAQLHLCDHCHHRSQVAHQNESSSLLHHFEKGRFQARTSRLLIMKKVLRRCFSMPCTNSPVLFSPQMHFLMMRLKLSGLGPYGGTHVIRLTLIMSCPIV